MNISYRIRTMVTTAAILQQQNPILLEGELATESDTLRQKIGDGVTAYNDLDYLPAALAVTAVQPEDLAAVATTGAYGDLSGRPTIPSTPAEVGAATAAQGSLADSAVQPGDLATVATTGAYSDLSGRPTLLGLSDAAPQAPGTPAAGTATDASRADHVHALPPTVTTEAAGLMRPVDLGDVIVVACSNETTNLTAGTDKATFRMPWAATLTGVRASVNEAPTGSTLVVDINEAGTSVLGTLLSIDADETTSATAATAAVISDSALADNAIITIDIDQIGSTNPGKGLKVTLYVTRVQP